MDESNKKMYFDVFQFNWNTHVPVCNFKDKSVYYYWKCWVSKYFPQGLHRNQPKTHNWGSMSIQWQRESSIGPSYFNMARGIQISRRLWKLVRIWSKVKGLKFKEKQKKGFSEDFWNPLCDWYSLHEKTTTAFAHVENAIPFNSVCQETIKKTN